MKLYDQPKVALKTRMMVKSRTSFIDGGVRGPFARNTTVVLQIPHRKRQGLAPHRRGTAQETRPSDDFLQQCARDNNLNVRTLDLPICSPWTFRENHSCCCCCCHPICCLRRDVSLDTSLKTLQPGSQSKNHLYCEQEKPAHRHGSSLLRLRTHQIQNRTRDAHKISPHGTRTKRTPAMNWDHAVSWGGGLG